MPSDVKTLTAVLAFAVVTTRCTLRIIGGKAMTNSSSIVLLPLLANKPSVPPAMMRAIVLLVLLSCVAADTTIHCCEDREFQESVKFSKTTDCTTSTTGALTMAGGLGVKLKANVGGNLDVGGTVTATAGASTLAGLTVTTIASTDTTDAANSGVGAMKTAGGLGVKRPDRCRRR